MAATLPPRISLFLNWKFAFSSMSIWFLLFPVPGFIVNFMVWTLSNYSCIALNNLFPQLLMIFYWVSQIPFKVPKLFLWPFWFFKSFTFTFPEFYDVCWYMSWPPFTSQFIFSFCAFSFYYLTLMPTSFGQLSRMPFSKSMAKWPSQFDLGIRIIDHIMLFLLWQQTLRSATVYTIKPSCPGYFMLWMTWLFWSSVILFIFCAVFIFYCFWSTFFLIKGNDSSICECLTWSNASNSVNMWA